MPPPQSTALKGSRDRTARSRSNSLKRRLAAKGSNTGSAADPTAQAVTSQEVSDYVKSRLIRDNMGEGFHPANRNNLWWPSPTVSDPTKPLMPYTVAAFVTNANKVFEMSDLDAENIKDLEYGPRAAWFKKNGIPTASLIGASIQAPRSILVGDNPSSEALATWLQRVDSVAEASAISRLVEDPLPGGMAGSATRPRANRWDIEDVAFAATARMVTRLIIEFPEHFCFTPEEFYIARDGQESKRTKFATGLDTANTRAHQRALKNAMSSLVTCGLMPCGIPGLRADEVPLQYLMSGSVMVMTEMEASLAIVTSVSESTDLGCDLPEGTGASAALADFQWRWFQGIAVVAPNSWSLIPDTSPALHSLPTYEQINSTEGIKAAQTMVLENLVAEVEAEWEQIEVEQNQPDATLTVPYRSAVPNTAFNDLENRIFNNEVPSIREASEKTEEAWITVSSAVPLGIFPRFVDEDGRLPGGADSRPCISEATFSGRTLSHSDAGVFNTAEALLEHIQLGQPASMMRKTNRPTRAPSTDPFGLFQSPPSEKKKSRTWSPSATIRSPRIQPSSAPAPQGASSSGMIVAKQEPVGSASDDPAMQPAWGLEVKPMSAKIEFPKADAFIDFWLSEPGMIAIENSNPPHSMPYSLTNWSDYNTDGTILVGPSWDLWNENAMVQEVVVEATADNTQRVDPAAVDRFRPVLLEINQLIASDATPRAEKTTAPDPANFHIFAFNPVEIRELPTTENIKYVAVCTSAKKRKRVAGAAVAMACEARSRNRIQFTLNEAWAKEVANDPNWKDMFSRLAEPVRAPPLHPPSSRSSSQLLKFLPVTQQRRVRVAFGLNGKVAQPPPVIDAQNFPPMAVPTAKRRAGTPSRNTPRVPLDRPVVVLARPAPSPAQAGSESETPQYVGNCSDSDAPRSPRHSAADPSPAGIRHARIGATHRHKEDQSPARAPNDGDDEREQEVKDLEGAAERAKEVLDPIVIDALDAEERKALNNRVAPLLRDNWRIDCFRPRGASSWRYEFCRNFNNPSGPDWCDKTAETRHDVPGHTGSVRGCVKAERWSVHGCCRCGQLGHPYTACTVLDANLPLPDLSGAIMPGREIAEKKEIDRWKKNKYVDRDREAAPQQTSWSSASSWSRR